MSGECDRCGEHCLDCKCKNHDETTIISLYDTVKVLEKRNPNWDSDEFCQKILAWHATFFLNAHADQVIQEKCPHLKELCVEYRELKTMNGKKLHHLFGMKALSYIMPNFEEPSLEGPFGTSPVWIDAKKNPPKEN